MKTLRLLSLATLVSAAFAPTSAFADGQITVQKELFFNTQTGASTTAVYGTEPYGVGVEIDGFPAVTSATVSVNGGTPIDLSQGPDGDIQYWTEFASAAAREAAVPQGATYTVRLNNSANVVITGPSGTFASYLPATPVFTIAGVTGVWSTRGDGMGVFTVTNPISNFTVTRNAYSVGTSGGNFLSSVDVYSGDSENSPMVGTVGTGILSDSASKPAETITFTTNQAAGNASDSDGLISLAPGTYLFEGGFNNISSYGTGTVLGDPYESAFVTSNYTQFVLTVVPEPGTYGLLGAGALGAVALIRRRKTKV